MSWLEESCVSALPRDMGTIPVSSRVLDAIRLPGISSLVRDLLVRRRMPRAADANFHWAPRWLGR
jgi:hypothetical protein